MYSTKFTGGKKSLLEGKIPCHVACISYYVKFSVSMPSSYSVVAMIL